MKKVTINLDAELLKAAKITAIRQELTLGALIARGLGKLGLAGASTRKR